MIAQRVDVNLGNAHRVLGGIEVGAVSLVGELNLHLQLLCGLPVIEVKPHVMNLGIEVLEFDDVIDFSDAILVIEGFR